MAYCFVSRNKSYYSKIHLSIAMYGVEILPGLLRCVFPRYTVAYI